MERGREVDLPDSRVGLRRAHGDPVAGEVHVSVSSPPQAGEHERRQQRTPVDQPALLVLASLGFGVAVESASSVEKRLDVLRPIEPNGG